MNQTKKPAGKIPIIETSYLLTVESLILYTKLGPVIKS